MGSGRHRRGDKLASTSCISRTRRWRTAVKQPGEKIFAVLRKIREDFEYILYRPFKLNADGDTVRH